MYSIEEEYDIDNIDLEQEMLENDIAEEMKEQDELDELDDQDEEAEEAEEKPSNESNAVITKSKLSEKNIAMDLFKPENHRNIYKFKKCGEDTIYIGYVLAKINDEKYVFLVNANSEFDKNSAIKKSFCLADTKNI